MGKLRYYLIKVWIWVIDDDIDKDDSDDSDDSDDIDKDDR